MPTSVPFNYGQLGPEKTASANINASTMLQCPTQSQSLANPTTSYQHQQQPVALTRGQYGTAITNTVVQQESNEQISNEETLPPAQLNDSNVQNLEVIDLSTDLSQDSVNQNKKESDIDTKCESTKKNCVESDITYSRDDDTRNVSGNESVKKRKEYQIAKNEVDLEQKKSRVGITTHAQSSINVAPSIASNGYMSIASTTTLVINDSSVPPVSQGASTFTNTSGGEVGKASNQVAIGTNTLKSGILNETKTPVFVDETMSNPVNPPQKTNPTCFSITQIPSQKQIDSKMASSCASLVGKYVKLDHIPDSYFLPKLSSKETNELEDLLQFRDMHSKRVLDNWKEDWSGNLHLVHKDIIVNRARIKENPTVRPITNTFLEYVEANAPDGSPDAFRGIKLLFAFLYHFKDFPAMAKNILSYSLYRPAKDIGERRNFIVEAVRRISYDPIVLQEDGWITEKLEEPKGLSGGAYLIGRHLIWQRYEAIVIAFVRDDEIGDLWKAMWLEDNDTFDLEADELQDAIKKYEIREAKKRAKMDIQRGQPNVSVTCRNSNSRTQKPSTSSRFAATSNFTVEGIEHGIVLASSYHSQARFGLLWPARVMHVSELQYFNGKGITSKRSSQKNNISVVFLAPYWNVTGTGNATMTTATNPYSTGNLFEMETIEVSPSTIQKYPHDVDTDSISIDKLKDTFLFLGLPKLAFGRFVDSHRLALGLKSYAKKHLTKNDCAKGEESQSCAALTETHTLSVQTAIFPRALLNLPFDFILSELQTATHSLSARHDDVDEVEEPILQFQPILKAMVPPFCFRETTQENAAKSETLDKTKGLRKNYLNPLPSTITTVQNNATSSLNRGVNNSANRNISISDFANDHLIDAIADSKLHSLLQNLHLTSLNMLSIHISNLLNKLRHISSISKEKKVHLIIECLLTKGYGEESICSANPDTDGYDVGVLTVEWRKACENLYKFVRVNSSYNGCGNGVTAVITDSRCNQHITAVGSFERAVRLPAALKASKMAGAGVKVSIPLLHKVEEKYMEIVEKKVLPRAHESSYLRRIKNRISALPNDAKGVPLTDDSEGEGGTDTMGSRGSYTAAVAGVAAALQAVEMVIKGECVNAFCAVRPPGHHAGRGLRAMDAISNGFCLLNGAACASIYATMSVADGGLGLKRVCVIDFDVHHGNGTQDIICSTYDSRYLYVSVHAGGPHINGFQDADRNGKDTGAVIYGNIGFGSKEQDGIFPGRCGDTSPHPGVLNIPLGNKVTAHAIGNAIVTRVSPAVREFSPDLIILSSGFDAHKNDPMGLGALSAEDFGSITELACQMAAKCCSGRVVSLLEGGYGVPCCRPLKDVFLPNVPPNNTKILDLWPEIPDEMEDNVDVTVLQRLDKCHSEGFLQCVFEHVKALSRNNGKPTTS